MPSPTLLDIFQNDLILRHTSPYIGTASLFSLQAVCRTLNKIIRSEPQVFRYLDLSSVRSINKPKWPPNSASNLTTDEYYGKPVHDAFEALRICSCLEHVSTLILDSVHLPCKTLFSILNDGRNRIRTLSLQAVQLLSQDELAYVLRYVTRTGRPKGTPSLKALYYFRGKGVEASIERMFRDTTMIGEHEGITTRSGASLGGAKLSVPKSSINDDPYEHSPYVAAGPCLSNAQDKLSDDWANLVRSCKGLIAFDMVLCPHDPARLVQPDPRPKFATIRLPPCSQCNSCPEGAAFPGTSVSQAVLSLPFCLIPVPGVVPSAGSRLKPDETFLVK